MESEATAVFQGKDNGSLDYTVGEISIILTGLRHRNENEDLRQNPFLSVLHMQPDRTQKRERIRYRKTCTIPDESKALKFLVLLPISHGILANSSSLSFSALLV